MPTFEAVSHWYMKEDWVPGQAMLLARVFFHRKMPNTTVQFGSTFGNSKSQELGHGLYRVQNVNFFLDKPHKHCFQSVFFLFCICGQTNRNLLWMCAVLSLPNSHSHTNSQCALKPWNERVFAIQFHRWGDMPVQTRVYWRSDLDDWPHWWDQ